MQAGQLTILVTAAVAALFDIAALEGWVAPDLKQVLVPVLSAGIMLLLSQFGYQQHQLTMQARSIAGSIAAVQANQGSNTKPL